MSSQEAVLGEGILQTWNSYRRRTGILESKVGTTRAGAGLCEARAGVREGKLDLGQEDTYSCEAGLGRESRCSHQSYLADPEPICPPTDSAHIHITAKVAHRHLKVN